MAKQRLYLIIWSIGGMISTFLPWLFHSVYGNMFCFLKGGWATFLLFFIILLLSLPTSKDNGPIIKWRLWISVILSFFAIVSAFIVSGSILADQYVNTVVFEQDPKTGMPIKEIPFKIEPAYGIYFVLVIGILLILFAFLLKRKGHGKVELEGEREGKESQSPKDEENK